MQVSSGLCVLQRVTNRGQYIQRKCPMWTNLWTFWFFSTASMIVTAIMAVKETVHHKLCLCLWQDSYQVTITVLLLVTQDTFCLNNADRNKWLCYRLGNETPRNISSLVMTVSHGFRSLTAKFYTKWYFKIMEKEEKVPKVATCSTWREYKLCTRTCVLISPSLHHTLNTPT